MGAFALRRSSPLPGFGLSFGITMALLSIVVLLPLAALAEPDRHRHDEGCRADRDRAR